MRQKIIILGIFLSIFLSGLSLQNTIVSAQYTPDNGFISWDKTKTFQVYSSGSAFMTGTDATSWHDMWYSTASSGIGCLEGIKKTGWTVGNDYKANYRSVFWFDTAPLSDDLGITEAWLTITSVHSGTAPDETNFYACYYSDQSPPIQNNNYVRTNSVSSAFDGDSTSRIVTIPVSGIVKTGFTCYQFMSYSDVIAPEVFSQTVGDSNIMTISSITLTVTYSIQPPRVTYADPIDGATLYPNPRLFADVKSYGDYFMGHAYLYSNASGSWMLRQTVSLAFSQTATLNWQEYCANTTGLYYWKIACRLDYYPTSWQNFTFSYYVIQTIAGSITPRSYSGVTGGSIIFDAVCPLPNTTYSAKLIKLDAPLTTTWYNFTSGSNYLFAGAFDGVAQGLYRLNLTKSTTWIATAPHIISIRNTMNNYTIISNRTYVKQNSMVKITYTVTGITGYQFGYVFENKITLLPAVAGTEFLLKNIGTYTFFVCDFGGTYTDINAKYVNVYVSESGQGEGYDDSGALIVIGLVVVMCVGSVLALVLHTPFGFIIGAAATAYILSLEALGDLRLLPTEVGYGLIVVLVLAGVIIWFLD